MGKSGVLASPKRWTSTFSLSSLPMGTEGSIIWGISSMRLWSSASSSFSCFSSSARRSACSFTWALTASASWSLEGSFLDWPMSMPICLERVLRLERSWSASAMAARRLASRSMTSSTRGSLLSWNFFWMFSLTASGFSRMKRISSMMISFFRLN